MGSGENREREGEEEGGRWWPWEVEASEGSAGAGGATPWWFIQLLTA